MSVCRPVPAVAAAGRREAREQRAVALNADRSRPVGRGSSQGAQGRDVGRGYDARQEGLVPGRLGRVDVVVPEIAA